MVRHPSLPGREAPWWWPRCAGPRGAGHHAALRLVSNRLVGILHGCLKTRTSYNETNAWGHHSNKPETTRS
jgi:hypothetical protein